MLHFIQTKRNRDSRLLFKATQTTNTTLKWVLPLVRELKNERSRVGGEEDNFYKRMPSRRGSCLGNARATGVHLCTNGSTPTGPQDCSPPTSTPADQPRPVDGETEVQEQLDVDHPHRHTLGSGLQGSSFTF